MIQLDPLYNPSLFHICDEFDTNPNDLHLIDAVKITDNGKVRPEVGISNVITHRSVPPTQVNVSEPPHVEKARGGKVLEAV